MDLVSRLWDKASPYKKHYTMLLRDTTMPRGSHYEFVSRTGFFEAASEDWLDAAKQTATQLDDPPTP